MKLPCTIHKKPALVVGYAPGRKGKPMAVVICEGKLVAVKLKDVDLGEMVADLQRKHMVRDLDSAA
jgi:hypothetical protein